MCATDLSENIYFVLDRVRIHLREGRPSLRWGELDSLADSREGQSGHDPGGNSKPSSLQENSSYYASSKFHQIIWSPDAGASRHRSRIRILWILFFFKSWILLNFKKCPLNFILKFCTLGFLSLLFYDYYIFPLICAVSSCWKCRIAKFNHWINQLSQKLSSQIHLNVTATVGKTPPYMAHCAKSENLPAPKKRYSMYTLTMW